VSARVGDRGRVATVSLCRAVEWLLRGWCPHNARARSPPSHGPDIKPPDYISMHVVEFGEPTLPGHALLNAVDAGAYPLGHVTPHEKNAAPQFGAHVTWLLPQQAPGQPELNAADVT